MTMTMFGPGDFSPGNMMYVGIAEEMEERRVDMAVDYIENTYGDAVSKQEMEDVFRMFDIDYMELPSWLQRRFDVFEITDF